MTYSASTLAASRAIALPEQHGIAALSTAGDSAPTGTTFLRMGMPLMRIHFDPTLGAPIAAGLAFFPSLQSTGFMLRHPQRDRCSNLRRC